MATKGRRRRDLTPPPPEVLKVSPSLHFSYIFRPDCSWGEMRACVNNCQINSIDLAACLSLCLQPPANTYLPMLGWTFNVFGRQLTNRFGLTRWHQHLAGGVSFPLVTSQRNFKICWCACVQTHRKMCLFIGIH